MEVSTQPGRVEAPPDPWPAPRPRTPVRATVTMPGSKSATNRALVLAALATGPSVLRAPLRSRDTLLMVRALSALGARVTDVDGGAWRVQPASLVGPASIECGLAGTVMRFLPPVAALVTGPVSFDGDAAARVRPMAGLLRALRGLGADIDDGGRGGLPFTVTGCGRLAGGDVTVDASASSQFVSGLLLAAARYDRGATVRHHAAGAAGAADTGGAGVAGAGVAGAGGRMPSRPHVAMTLAMLGDAGVTAGQTAPEVWRVEPGPVRPLDLDIEPDLSNAAPFLAAALATGGSVTVTGWPAVTSQAGDALRDLLGRMGGVVTRGPAGVTVAAGDRLLGLDADLHDVGELTPVLAALCALAETPSRLRGIGHLRGHETDRLDALATELTALGADVRQHADGLEIRPRPLSGGVFGTYHDHRMAQAGAVLGLAVDGIRVRDVATTSKTLPDFVGQWRALVGDAVGDPARGERP